MGAVDSDTTQHVYKFPANDLLEERARPQASGLQHSSWPGVFPNSVSQTNLMWTYFASPMATFPPARHSFRELCFVFAIAIIIGVVVGIGLTIVLKPRAESYETCVAREMKRQSQVNALSAQRICAQRHEIH
jgi:hypothetical protein